MAIQKQVKLLLEGTDVWNKWRAQHKEASIDLSQANLMRTDLSRANLSQANLDQANLSRADLRDAILHQANLGGANLGGANLSFVDLTEANLSYADLRGALLREANLDQAVVAWTHFADIDLRTVKGLDMVQRKAPPYISTSTLQLSQGDIPEAFLRNAGLTDTFITYVRSLVTRPIEYYTCFISYSSKNEDFAKRLYADLQSNGVRCWFAPHDLRPGTWIRQGIDEAILVYDKLVLILSQEALDSGWVQYEVEIASHKERERKSLVLFPLRIDNAILTCNEGWARTLRARHIGDFTHWKDYDTYQAAFQQLLRDLKAEAVKKGE